MSAAGSALKSSCAFFCAAYSAGFLSFNLGSGFLTPNCVSNALFILGFFIKNFLVWLDNFAVPKVPDNYKEEDWDWIQ